jgi:phage tail tape-measure protein
MPACAIKAPACPAAASSHGTATHPPPIGERQHKRRVARALNAVQAEQQMYNQDQVMVFNVALLRGNAGLTAAAMYIMREDMAYRVGQAVQEAARSLGGRGACVWPCKPAAARARATDSSGYIDCIHAVIEGSGRGGKTQQAESCPTQ